MRVYECRMNEKQHRCSLVDMGGDVCGLMDCLEGVCDLVGWCVGMGWDLVGMAGCWRLVGGCLRERGCLCSAFVI